MKKIVVLISGNGSNLQAIIDAIEKKVIQNAEISLVVSNRKNAFGLERASKARIPTLVFTLKSFKDQGKTREEYDGALAEEILERVEPDLLVLAGWMHILSPSFLNRFPRKIINLHPALPGEFDGINAIERAYEAFKEGRIKRTGIMVHYVIPAVDQGEVIKSQPVEIKAGDSLADLQSRIHHAEHLLLVETISYLVNKY